MLANDTRNSPDTMNAHERLTWDEICQRYPDEWVVLVEFERPDPDDLAFDAAVVLSHHKTRKAASPDVKAALEHGQEAGSFFTGRLVPPMPWIPLDIKSPGARLTADPTSKSARKIGRPARVLKG